MRPSIESPIQLMDSDREALAMDQMITRMRTGVGRPGSGRSGDLLVKAEQVTERVGNGRSLMPC